MREFNLETIKSITKDFSEDQKVGSGGFGVVYRGLYDGDEIAVKRLLHGPDNKEFENELLNISKVQHENVVKLVGFCCQSHSTVKEYRGQKILVAERERILCFELMHGALDKHIKDDYCDLDWPTCYKIIKGICEGINYLHTACEKPIWHLDLKPANILLDNNKNAKIADLGLSRHAKHTLVTKNNKGTQGYMPPEYVMSHFISEKYDVFSLGVLILNIMDGTCALTRCMEKRAPGQFVNYVRKSWNKRLLKEKPGHPSYKKERLQVKKCVELALQCMVRDRHKRPSTKDVVHELKQLDAEIEKLSQASDDDQICQDLYAQELNSSIEDMSSQIPSPDDLLVNSISVPGQLAVVIVYAFDCSDYTSAWHTVEDGVFWLVHQKLTHYLDCSLGYIYFMKNDNTYTSDMKVVNSEDNKETGFKKIAWRMVTCTEDMASGLAEAHKMITNSGCPNNGIILLISDGLINEGDFFDGAEIFRSKFPVHTFTLGGDEYNQGLHAIAANSPGGKFHNIPVPERPMLSPRFSLLLHSILERTTLEEKESPSSSSETQPRDVVLVYAFDCSDYTPDWTKMDGTIFWMVQEKLSRLEDSCLGFIYPMFNENSYTSDMKLVDTEEKKETEYTPFEIRTLSCTKNMASGLAEAHKMLRNRGNENCIILFFSDGLINEGDFFDGTENFKSEVPVHTFTLGGDAYNQGLQAIAENSPGGTFNPTPVPDSPELSACFSELLDSLLGTKTN